jgi:aminoglycoside phosphotransferase (APT) family kinase protein
VGAERWDGLRARADAAGAPWGAALADRVPDLLAAEQLLATEPPVPDQRCHLDFNPENVLVDASGDVVVIDWENSGGGLPEQEVAQALVEFGPDLLDGYRRTGGRFDPDGVDVFAMTFAVQGHLIDFYARRALDDPDGDNRRRALGRLATMLPDLLTVEAATRLLDQLA